MTKKYKLLLGISLLLLLAFAIIKFFDSNIETYIIKPEFNDSINLQIEPNSLISKDSQLMVSQLVEFKPDTSIWKYSLLNSDSVDLVLRQIILDSNLQISILNRDKSQILSLIKHPGSYKNDFSEFHIKYNVQNKSNLLIMMNGEFITDNNIKLGISPVELNKIKGKADSISGDSSQFVYLYKIDDFNSSSFLKYYNMPFYYSTYYFTKGKLTEFRFGFEYP